MMCFLLALATGVPFPLPHSSFCGKTFCQRPFTFLTILWSFLPFSDFPTPADAVGSSCVFGYLPLKQGSQLLC